MDLHALNDRDLLFETERMAQNERAFTIKLLHHLNEIGRRKLHLDLGYSSLYDYCVRKLKHSSSAAGRRIAAARCIRRFPDVLRLLEERELSLSTLSLIDPILNEENAGTILERVRGASHREVERVVCEYRPPVALRDRIRPVRVAAAEPVEIDALMLDRECERTVPAGHYHRRVPMTEQKMLVQFLASEELVEKFEQATALLSGRGSDVSFADVLDILVTEFLSRRSPAARREKREARKGISARELGTAENTTGGARQGMRNGATSPDSQRREWNNTHSRHVPAAVRDEVHVRDGGQCSFVTADGTRCAARKGLEIDQIRPVAAGGTSDASNLRLLCAAHNLRAAERTLGHHVMQSFWRQE